MIYLYMAITGLVISFLFKKLSNLKIRYLHILSVAGSLIGSLVNDTNQFSLTASLAGAATVVFIVCCAQRV
jgi:hypothetical protein